MGNVLHFPGLRKERPYVERDTGGRALQTAENTLMDVVAALMVCPDDRLTRMRCITYATHRMKLAQLCLDLALACEKEKLS